MPKSKKPNTHQWGIEYEGDVLALGSSPRRAVETYMGISGLRQPQAVANLLMAGYAQFVGLPLRVDGESRQEQSGTKISPKAGNEAHSKNK